MMQSNRARIRAFTRAYDENPKRFIQQEKVRTDAFIKWYLPSRYAVGGFVLIGTLMFLLTGDTLWKGGAIGLLLTGFSILLIDYFSEERATLYYRHIIAHLA